MNRKFTLENRFRIWDDDNGERIEVGDDPDGLGMTEVVWVSDEGKRGTPINLPTVESIEMMITALQQRLEWVKSHVGNES